MKEFIYNIIYKLTAFIIRIICRLNGGLEVIGRENIPAEGGVIIAPNHISYLDPPVIGAVLPRNGNFMARKGLFEIPVLGWMIKGAAFPVDRNRPRPSTIKEAVRRLKSGKIVILFPEGRRNETGDLLEAKRGLGMLASMSKAPIIPTLIIGTEKALPVDAKWLKRARMSVVFDKPIYYTFTDEGKPHGNQELHEQISEITMSAISKLKGKYGDNGR